MATWIAHLRLAEDLLERIPGLDPAQFAIGNIAPDSGIPDANWEHFDPPPEVTHFLRNDTSDDLVFYRKYLANAAPQDAGRFSLRMGYFFHLVTDNLWDKIRNQAKERFGNELKNDPNFRWEIKGDWYGLDFIYIRDHPDSLFWRVFLQAQSDAFDLDFVPKQALEHQLNYIKTFYQRQDEEIQAMYKRPYIYLPQADMDAFVLGASDDLYNAYQTLWPTPPDLTGKHSVLEIL